jgi:hypothetical protein
MHHADASHNNGIVPVEWRVSRPTCRTTLATLDVSAEYLDICVPVSILRIGQMLTMQNSVFGIR